MKVLKFFLTIIGLMLFFILLNLKCDSQRVKRVVDGDSFILETGENIRLAEIDCPEALQPFGLQAKNFTQAWILGKTVVIIRTAADKYKRTIAEVFINGQWLNKLLVINGYAWTYKKYSSPELYSLEQEAKAKHRGLWIDLHPEPPFIYRNKNHLL